MWRGILDFIEVDLTRYLCYRSVNVYLKFRENTRRRWILEFSYTISFNLLCIISARYRHRCLKLFSNRRKWNINHVQTKKNCSCSHVFESYPNYHNWKSITASSVKYVRRHTKIYSMERRKSYLWALCAQYLLLLVIQDTCSTIYFFANLYPLFPWK